MVWRGIIIFSTSVWGFFILFWFYFWGVIVDPGVLKRFSPSLTSSNIGRNTFKYGIIFLKEQFLRTSFNILALYYG